MAKLEGVKTLARLNGEITKIEYNGEVYEKVGTDSPKVGDIGMIIDAWADLTNGDFYTVKGFLDTDIPGTYHDLGDDIVGRVEDKDTMFFRKVDAAPSGLKEVDGPIVGGYVVFDEDFLDTTAGKSYEIVTVYSNGDDFDYLDDFKHHHGADYGYAGATFYVKAEDQPTSRLGETSGAKAGDTVEMTTNDMAEDYAKGDRFTVKNDGVKVYIVDNNGDDRPIDRFSHLEYKIVATTEEEAPMPKEIKIGDKVRLNTSDAYFGAGERVYGETGEVIKLETLPINGEVADVKFPSHDDFTALISELDIVEESASKSLFAKVDRPNNEPIVGDFIELDPEAADYSWLSEDKKYEIIDIDEDGDFIFNDDTGEGEWVENNDIKAIYVKYTQEQAEQTANIGDKILVINPVTPLGGYSEGDVLTVKDVGAFGVRNDVFAEELDEGPYLDAREYIVLNDEQKGEEETESKGEIKSDKYVPQEGDIVVITGNTSGSRNKVGDIGKVGEVEDDMHDMSMVRVYVKERDVEGANDCYTRYYEMRPATEAEKEKYYQAHAPKVEEGALIGPGDLVKVINSPLALPEGSYFIVKEVESDGRFRSVTEDGTTAFGGYIYDPKHVELIAKAASVYA